MSKSNFNQWKSEGVGTIVCVLSLDKPPVEWIKVRKRGNKWAIRDEYIAQKNDRSHR